MSVGIVQIPKNIVPLFYKHHELTKMNRYYLAINLLHELQISHSEHGLTMWKVTSLSHFIKSLSISLLIEIWIKFCNLTGIYQEECPVISQVSIKNIYQDNYCLIVFCNFCNHKSQITDQIWTIILMGLTDNLN